MLVKNDLKCILVDDEQNAIENLKQLLGMYCPSVKIVGTATETKSAALLIDTLRPDVLFLDISMPERNGFELLQILRHIPLIVFVTAHEQYALNAIKASAVDYLLKPVDIGELKKVEEKLLQIQAIRHSNKSENYNAVVGNLMNMLHSPGTIKKITLHDVQGYNIIDVSDILYLEGDDNYTTFYLAANKKILVSKTLKEYEGLLDDLGFFRIHKSYIINLAHLRNISRENGLDAVMSDGQTLSVSRRRSNDLLDRAKQYIR